MLKRMKACIQLRGKNVENPKIREATLAAFESAEVEDNFNPHDLDFDAVALLSRPFRKSMNSLYICTYN